MNPDYHQALSPPSSLRCCSPHLPVMPSLLHFSSLSDNRDTQGLPKSPPPLSLPPRVSLVNGCQSELGPHADWQQVSSCSWNNYDWAAVKMDSRVGSPHCAPLLPADGVLPWEAIIARCQLTAPVLLPARSALILGLSLGK